MSAESFGTDPAILWGWRTGLEGAIQRCVVTAQDAGGLAHRRGNGSDFVFTYKSRPVTRMNSTAWRKSRVATGLEAVRFHDLRHTFGMRLRAAGVSLEDRQDLLGHKSGRITTHYSAAELGALLAAVERWS